MYVPDCFSRCIKWAKPTQSPVLSSAEYIHVFKVLEINSSDLDKTFLQRIKKAHETDDFCQVLQKQIMKEWPEEKNQFLDKRLRAIYKKTTGYEHCGWIYIA